MSFSTPGPSTGSSTTHRVVTDVHALTQLFHHAVATPDDESLKQVTASFDALPSAFPPLFGSITGIIIEGRAAPHLQKWAATLLQSALCRSRAAVGLEERTSLALQSLRAVARLLASTSVPVQKIGLQCVASIYPLVFQHVCSGGDTQVWAQVTGLKATSVQIYRSGPLGCKLAAVKVLQRIIQTQTRGSADPRLQRTAEPNLSLCRPSHPFLRSSVLEDEANKLLEELITTLFTSPIPDLVSAVTTTLSVLVKMRPMFANLIITALSNWTPAALGEHSNTAVRSVEKTVRISLTHLLKTAHANAFAGPVTDFLNRQAARMEQSLVHSRSLRDADATRKRQSIADDLSLSSKRRRVEPDVNPRDVFAGGRGGMTGFDASSLPLGLVVDLIVGSFQSMGSEVLNGAIRTARQSLPGYVEDVKRAPLPMAQQVFQPLDPLKQDLGEEELELKVEVVEDEANNDDDEGGDASTSAAGFSLELSDDLPTLTTPVALSSSTKTSMMESAIRRICAAGAEGSAPSIWISLVSRLVTRGLGEEEEEGGRKESLRSIMFNFVIADVHSRMEFARLWLNEEWYVEGSKTGPSPSRPYDRWLRRILEHMLAYSSNKDRSFSQFIVDLPEIPLDEIARLGEMCLKPEQVHLGFSALRDLALLRPPVRPQALDILLGLATNRDKLTRNAAIMTVKRWVPDVKALSPTVVAFALSVLERLECPAPVATVPPAPVVAEGAVDGEEMEMDMDEDKEVVEEVLKITEVKDGKVVDHLPPPTTLDEVLQHVELFLALCVTYPALLVSLFDTFPRIQPFAQTSILTLISPMVRSLGSSHPLVSQVIETCPEGADSLALKLLSILTDKNRLPAPLMAAVKTLAGTREVSPKFLVMIISDCEKAEILVYLPRIVSTLDGTPVEKTIVRSVFLSAVASTASSIPGRPRTSKIAPVELIMLLHRAEKEIGLKSAIEAIAICFSMPDAFRPEVLAAFMSQAVDLPSLPVLFLRTVIQAATTYKTLLPFISSTLLPRLITKKVWTAPPLWEGFIRCVKVCVPGSYGAVCLLPKENLADLVGRVGMESVREGVREYLITKQGPGPPSPLLDILGPAPVHESISIN